MEKNSRLQDLTFAAMMLSAFFVMYFIFPSNSRGIQSIVGVITPIPIIVYAYVSNINGYAKITISGIFLTLVFFEPILAISFIIPNLILGITIGFLLKKKCKYIYLLVAVISVILNLYELFINYLVTGIDFIEINLDSINASMLMLQEQYKNFNSKIFYDINVFAIPIMMATGCLGKGLILVFVSKVLLKRIIDKDMPVSYTISFSVKRLSIVLLCLLSFTIFIWICIIGNCLSYNAFYSLLLDITAIYLFVYSGLYVVTKKYTNNQITLMQRVKLILWFLVILLICPVLAIKELISDG